MSLQDKGQRWDLDQPRARFYENCLVPAVYAQWAIRLMQMIDIEAGHRVLDVGCGTGILARKACEEVGLSGHVAGLDADAEMLEVAVNSSLSIDWRQGEAGQLPFEDAVFDRVLSQFLLPYVRNRVAALREMWRVTRVGGKLGLTVWGPLHSAPAFIQLQKIIDRIAGSAAAEAFALPWDLGSRSKLRATLDSAGFSNYSVTPCKGSVRFPGAGELVFAWVRLGPAYTHMNESTYRMILTESRNVLQPVQTGSGELVLPMDTIVVIARKD